LEGRILLAQPLDHRGRQRAAQCLAWNAELTLEILGHVAETAAN
jgi:hypothetical protein